MRDPRDLQSRRDAYADQLRRDAHLRSDALVRAFASVQREDYLGPGPWRVLEIGRGYQTTEDDDPRHLYRDVLVAIDESRLLNNGQPTGLAGWLDALDIASGDRALHIGAGVGYYTAIIAEVVGPKGRVTGVELDPDLAARARDNLAHYDWVDVVCADGSRYNPGPRDVIFVNAGATSPQPIWLDSLDLDGRLLFPLTVAYDAGGIGVGQMLGVARRETGLEARFVSPVGIYPCIGARDDEPPLRAAYNAGRTDQVRSLRREPHDLHPSCWLHAPAYCLSTLEPEASSPSVH